MAIQCAHDGQHLAPGKRVLLNSYMGLSCTPSATQKQYNYWLLLNTKGALVDGVVRELKSSPSVLVVFDQSLASLGLVTSTLEITETTENVLWIALSDLKFVCRY